MGRDYLGWSKAEIRAGHPIETAAERRAWFPTPSRWAQNDARGSARERKRIPAFPKGTQQRRVMAASLRSSRMQGLSFRRPYLKAVGKIVGSGPAYIRATGTNVGSFKHRRGQWTKGKGGRFVGSR
jgi:hypothetical protein